MYTYGKYSIVLLNADLSRSAIRLFTGTQTLPARLISDGSVVRFYSLADTSYVYP
jgi:hypothetical protein